MSYSNILAVYQLSTAAERIEGANWYKRAKELAFQLAHSYGVSQITAAGVIAALSPRNKWERNMIDAENLIRVFSTDPESVESVKVCTFGFNKAKAIRILAEPPATDEEALDILSGPKLREFYSCIVGIEGEVCIDGHAYSIWAGNRITLGNIPKIGKKLREQIKFDYCCAAQGVGMPAYQLQAVTWCTWRRLHNALG